MNMSYSGENFNTAVITALNNAANVVGRAGISNDEDKLAVTLIMEQFLGDEKVKRELQILLDEFASLFSKRVEAALKRSATTIETDKKLMYLENVIKHKLSSVGMIPWLHVSDGKYDIQLYKNDMAKFILEIQERIDIL